MNTEHTDFLTTLTTGNDAIDPALHARLERAAAAGGILDLGYRTLDTPIGSLLLVASDDGLVYIAFEREGHDAVLERLAGEVSPRVLRAPGRLDPAAHELDEYFEGRRVAFDLPLDFRLVHGFRRDTLEQLLRVPYGRTASYTAIDRAAGRPKAARAVGSACANNPIPLVVPCHRIVRSDGVIGEYRGGTEAKRALLALEGAASGQLEMPGFAG
jgi:methylated-DNA-[protein]-cysteine S-methyltransferase